MFSCSSGVVHITHARMQRQVVDPFNLWNIYSFFNALPYLCQRLAGLLVNTFFIKVNEWTDVAVSHAIAASYQSINWQVQEYPPSLSYFIWLTNTGRGHRSQFARLSTASKIFWTIIRYFNDGCTLFSYFLIGKQYVWVKSQRYHNFNGNFAVCLFR